ncbi:hypothetical protein Bca4012_103296 [Brassica carinata]
MGGGAWPFLVGGAICLVNSVNERDLSLLTSYVEASLHGRLLRGTMALNQPKDHSRTLETQRPSDETPLSVGGLLADSVPADFRGYVFRPRFKTYLGLGRIVRIASGFHQTPARKVSRNMQLNSLLSPTRRRCLFGKSVNHRVFERKLRPKPSGRGTSAWVSQIVVPILSRIWDGRWSPVCYRPRLAKIRAKGARSVSTCGGEFKPRNIVGRYGPEALDDPKSSTRPQVRRDHPLSLSISISGGKETNKDSLSNGERTGKSPA